MNRPLLGAALLGGLTTLIHLLGGGQDVATPLLAAPLEPSLKFTLYAVWHMASLALLASTAPGSTACAIRPQPCSGTSWASCG